MKKFILSFLILCIFSVTGFSTALSDFIFKGGYQLDSGLPAAGYYLYIYESDTTTYKESWSRREEGIAYLNTQPVTLDSRGACDIFCRGVYKFVVKDSNLVTVKTWNGVDYTQNTGTTISLVDGSDTIQAYFDADGVSYVNGGNFGIGIAVPLSLVHISGGSPTITIADETTSEDIQLINAGGKVQLRNVSGASDELLWEADIGQTVAPTGFYNTPVGAIQMYAGTTAPSGWLLCQGQAVSRTGYSDIFAVIGTTYGVGDGSTTFNLPDMQGKYPRGKDGSFALGAACADTTAAPSAGNPSGTTGTQSASHTHSGTTGATNLAHTHSESRPEYTGSYFTGGSNQTGSTGVSTANTGAASPATMNHTHPFTSGNQSASHTHNVTINTGWDTETRPNSVVVNYIIYAGVK